MAKLAKTKSKAPDSRLTPLATSFRPGQKRIALPTSRFSGDRAITDSKSSHVELELKETRENLTEKREIQDRPTELSSVDSTQPITEKLDPQTNVSTRHNSAQLVRKLIEWLPPSKNYLETQQK